VNLTGGTRSYVLTGSSVAPFQRRSAEQKHEGRDKHDCGRHPIAFELRRANDKVLEDCWFLRSPRVRKG
jgi:hypothetical protein